MRRSAQKLDDKGAIALDLGFPLLEDDRSVPAAILGLALGDFERRKSLARAPL
jgi:hypothetical protein